MEFTVDGERYTLPELDTRILLDTLVLDPPACWWNLVPARLTGWGGDTLWARMVDLDDPFDLDDLEHVAETVLSAVVGMDFHAARRLAASAYGNWVLFDGWCFSRGLNPLTEPIGRMVAACYTWRRALCEQQRDLYRLDAEIWAPPPVTTLSGKPRDPTPAGWTDEVEAASFDQAMSLLGSGA